MNMNQERFMYDDAARGRDFIISRLKDEGVDAAKITDGMVLGSGLGGFVKDHMDADRSVEIPFNDVFDELGGVERSGESAPGHAQKIVIGSLKGDSLESGLVMAQAGREHPYQAIDPKRATFWVRIMQLLGVETFFGSNAVGILTPDTMKLPSLMLVKGHIDKVTNGPLVGPNYSEFGPRFPHAGDLYPAKTRELVKEKAKELGIALQEGILFREMGPSYESTAIIYELRDKLEGIWEQGQRQKGEHGFDGPPVGAVGMSSTIEHEVCQHASPIQNSEQEKHPNRAFGKGRAHISVGTNYACGLGPDGPGAFPSHQEVQENGKIVQEIFGRLARAVILEMRKQ